MPLLLFFEAGPQGRAPSLHASPLVSPSTRLRVAESFSGPASAIFPEKESELQRLSRTASEDAPERSRRSPAARSLRKEPKELSNLGLPSLSEKGRKAPSGRPAGLLEAAAAPCWMLCSLSEENPSASPEPRYREGRRFPRGGGQRPPAAGP